VKLPPWQKGGGPQGGSQDKTTAAYAEPEVTWQW
jgi:hypothetical protein